MSERVPASLRRQLNHLAKHRCEYCLYPTDLADFPLELVNGFIQPRTDIGRVTVRLLALNDDKRVSERCLAIELGMLNF